jgi:hypothetical protein
MTTHTHSLPARAIVIEHWLRGLRYRYPQREIVVYPSACGGFLVAEVRTSATPADGTPRTVP